MTTLQKIAITAAITAAVGVGLYENRQAAQAREQLQSLQQREDPLKEQVRRLSQERDETTAQLAVVRGQNEALRANLNDLPKLRGEVGRLRDSARELAQIKAAATNNAGGDDSSIDGAFKTWAVRAARLRQRLDQAPDKRIPEMQLLTEKNWFDAVKDLKQLDTDDDFRQAFANARNLAKSEFGQILQKALRDYTTANNGQLPSDLAQLKPFFSQPVDDAVLQRYKLLQTGSLNDLGHGDYIVADVAPLVDEYHDATYKFSLNGTSSHIGDPIEDAVKTAGIQYAQAHNGLLPTDAAQITPYLQKPLTQDQIKHILSKIPPGITTLSQLEAIEK